MEKQHRSNKNNFDFDSYLNEKASETSGKNPEQKEEVPANGNFFRNFMLITALVLVSVLYIHDWNPMNVYHRFFPENAEITEITSPSLAELEARLAARNTEYEAQRAPQFPETQEQLRNEQAIRLSELQRKAAELTNSDEIAALTNETAQIALETTLEALNQIDWDEFGRQFEGLGAQIEAEVLRELAESTPNDYQVLTNWVNGLSLSSYTEKLNDLGIDQFSSTEIENLYQAEIPIGFFELLEKSNKLSELSAEQIIDLFE